MKFKLQINAGSRDPEYGRYFTNSGVPGIADIFSDGIRPGAATDGRGCQHSRMKPVYKRSSTVSQPRPSLEFLCLGRSH
jgi:hypothetical protein